MVYISRAMIYISSVLSQQDVFLSEVDKDHLKNC